MELFKKAIPRRFLTLALAIVMVMGLASTSFAAFSDIPAGHEFEGYVEDLHEKGIIDGYPDGTFGLNDNLRRGQAAKMIAIAAGLEHEGKEADFEDVPEGHEMSPYIAALVDEGAIRGFPDGSFKMHNNITRRQIAQIIVKAFGLTKGDKEVELSDLDDLDETTRNYIEILASNDIVSGYPDGSFGPNDQVKRGQFTKIVSRAMEAVEEAEALAVESVSAINDITVEYGTVLDDVLPLLPSTVTATLNDGTEVTLNVTWTADEAYNAEVAGDYTFSYVLSIPEDEELEYILPAELAAGTITVTVKEEVRIPAAITTDAESPINAVVGDEVSITYTVKDANGKPVKGTDVRVRAIDNAWPNDVVKEQVLTTDENGQVTFTYTSIDGREDKIEAVVIAKPTLRDSSVTVSWVATAATVTVESPTAKGFIVNTATNIPAELQTIKYVATFKDENGNPLADGKVVSVDLTGVTGTLAAGTDNDFIPPTTGSVYTATLANGDGTAVLEFTTDTAQEIAPLFYYDANNNSTLDSDEPRAKGATVEVVDETTQEPTFTLELKEVDEDNNINTDVTEVDGELKVTVSSGVEYLLTAVDQYGNPFIGTVQLSHKCLLDNIAANDNLKGSIVFNASEVDGTYAAATSIDFDTIDTNADGVVQVKIAGGAAGNVTSLVVWVDANSNSKLDADEPRIETPTIEFVAAEAPVLTSMAIEADATSVVANGTNKVTYTVELLDQDGNALDVSSNTVDVIIELYQDDVKLDQSTSATKVDTATIGTYAAAGENVKVTGINAADGKFTFTVLPAAADAGSSFYPVVYFDINSSGTIEADEEETATQGPAFTATALPNSYSLELSKTEVTAGETIDVTITALNSSSATEVNFDGEQVVMVEILNSTSTTLKTYLREANFVDGVATVSVPVELVASNSIKVTMPIGTTATSTETLTVTPAAAAKLAVDSSDNLYVADEFGNKADYNYAGLAEVTNVKGTLSVRTLSVTPDAEGNVLIKIINGDVFESNGIVKVTYVQANVPDPATLTLALKNGDTFSVTVE